MEVHMKKKQFGILLTVSLSKEMYEMVKTLSDQYQVSMGEVIRNSIDHLSQYDTDWLTSKPRNIVADQKENSLIDMHDYNDRIDLEGKRNV